MPLILAESVPDGIPVSYVLTALMVMSSGAVVVVGFLWKSFLKHQKEIEANRAADAMVVAELKSELKECQAEIKVMVSINASNSNFVAAVIGMSMNGDTILSAKVQDLYHHFKPADQSGAHKALAIPKDRK